VGTHGEATAANFVQPHVDDRVLVSSGHGDRVEHLGTRSSYTYQLEALRSHLRDATPPPRGPDAPPPPPAGTPPAPPPRRPPPAGVSRRPRRHHGPYRRLLPRRRVRRPPPRHPLSHRTWLRPTISAAQGPPAGPQRCPMPPQA